MLSLLAQLISLILALSLFLVGLTEWTQVTYYWECPLPCNNGLCHTNLLFTLQGFHNITECTGSSLARSLPPDFSRAPPQLFDPASIGPRVLGTLLSLATKAGCAVLSHSRAEEGDGIIITTTTISSSSSETIKLDTVTDYKSCDLALCKGVLEHVEFLFPLWVIGFLVCTLASFLQIYLHARVHEICLSRMALTLRNRVRLMASFVWFASAVIAALLVAWWQQAVHPDLCNDAEDELRGKFSFDCRVSASLRGILLVIGGALAYSILHVYAVIKDNGRVAASLNAGYTEIDEERQKDPVIISF